MKRSKARVWVLSLAAGAALLLGLAPLETLAGLGRRVSPSGAIMDKTVLLLSASRITMPLMGALLAAWLILPKRYATVARSRATAFLDWRWASLTVFGLAVLVRIGWLLIFPTQPYADSQWYLDRAHWLSQGHGYVLDPVSGIPTAAWPPGYPWLLSLVFRLTGVSVAAGLWLNVLMGGMIVWLAVAFGTATHSRRAGVLTGLILALLPGLVVYTTLLNSDLLFMVLVLAALALAATQADGVATWWQALGVGVLLAAAALTRSLGLALLPLVAVVRHSLASPRSPRRTLLWTALAGLALAACVAPWTMRNHRAFGRTVIISTNGGLNFWMGNNPGAGGAYHAPKDPAANPLLAFVGDELALDAAGYEYGMAFVRANPRRAIALWPAKVFYLYNSNEGGIYWNQRSALDPLQFGTGPEAYWLTNLAYSLLLALALFGVAQALLDGRVCGAWLPVLFLAWWTVLHLPFFGADRFALPALPMLALLAANGLLWVIGQTVDQDATSG